MNPAHLHLAINHLPVMGVFFGLLLFIISFRYSFKELRKGALIIWVIAAVGVIPTYLSGEGAEDLLEQEPGVSEETIEEHEEAALPVALMIGFLGVLSLASWLMLARRDRLPGAMAALLLVVGIVSFFMAARLANLGGMIRHPEISPDFRSTAPNQD